MANEFVARKGIISLGDLTVDTLSGNNGEIITLDANGKFVASGVTTDNIVSGLVSSSAQINHDSTTGFVANEHINHTSVSVNAGNGLTGGGTIAATRTINVASANNGIVVNADNISLDTASTTFTTGVKSKLDTDGIFSGSAQVSHDSTTGFVANEHINHTSVSISGGTGLTGGGNIASNRTISVDYAGTDNFILAATNGTSLGNLEGSDKIAFVDLDNNVKYAQVDQLPFNNFTYTHPTHAGDDISVDTGALTGATVISDLDFNVTTDTLGHVTDANAAISTRNLTLGDLGYTGTTDANTYVHPNHTGDVTSSGDGATTLAAAAITGKTALTTGLVSTDELLVSDAGTLKRMDVSVMQAYMQSNLTFTTNTDVDVSVANLEARLAQVGDVTIGDATTVTTFPGDIVVTGTTTTNNVETVSTSNGVVFEGNAADANELTLLAGTLTADRTVTLPDATGTVALTSNIGNATITIGSGNGLTGGAAFTANQSANETITLNIGAGDGITVNANDIQVDSTVLRTTGDSVVSGSAQINHDSTTGFVANEHIDHSGVSITAGTGLTGGGTIAASRTINVIGGDGITANANDIQVDSTVIRTTGNQSMSGTKTFTGKLVLDTDSGDDVDMFTDYTATVANATTATIASYTSAAGVAVFFDYRIQDGTTNLRAGTVMAISNGSTVAYTEYSTGDIGDTTQVVLSVDYSGGAIRLRAQNDQAPVRTNVFVRTV